MGKKPVYKRVLIKISGEALAGDKKSGLDFGVIGSVCEAVKKCLDLGVEVGVVIGGGNFWRGVKDGSGKIERTRADHMGMLATVMNCLAVADVMEQHGIDVRVHPTMIPVTHQLATVNGVMNAIYVVGDAVGETMFFGAGAGSGPAASAVMGDVIEVARHVELGCGPIVGCTCTDNLPIVPMEDLKTKYYIRFSAADRSGVLAAMAGVFAKHNVSVFSVVQRGNNYGDTVDLAYVTHVARERDIRAVLAEIAELDDVLHAEPSLIRVED